MAMPAGFNPFQGIQVLSGVEALMIVLSASLFQSLSGNSSVVGSCGYSARKRKLKRFNPFQGIQVLSGSKPTARNWWGAGVSIPFREFKCCREKLGRVNDVLVQTCFNPFQGIQVLSGDLSKSLIFFMGTFQSLSGNSSVVGHSRENINALLHVWFQSLSGNSSVVGQGK